MAAAGLKIGSDSFPLLLPFTYFKTEPRINCGLILRFLKLERRARLLCRQRRLLFPASGISSSWGLLRRLPGEFSGAYLEDCLPGGLYLEDCTWRIAYLESGREKVEVQNPIHRHVLLGLSRNNFKWIYLAAFSEQKDFTSIYLLQDFSFWPCGSSWSSCAQCLPVIKMVLYGHKLIKNKLIGSASRQYSKNDRLTDSINAEVVLLMDGVMIISLTGGATDITLMKYRTWPILDS